jgi:hypothetical protein
VQIKIVEELTLLEGVFLFVGKKNLAHSSLRNMYGKWDLIMQIKKEKG